MRVLTLFALLACAAPSPVREQQNSVESAGVPVRVLKVRAWADPDYQALAPDWSARIAAQVAGASAVVERQFGVRLELEPVRPWARKRTDTTLREALEELEIQDGGADTGWVVGFVAPLRMPSNVRDEQGTARAFGRHLVLRGTSAPQEVALFLHHWAHTMGAFHERAKGSLLAGADEGAPSSSFPDGSARIIGLGLDYRDSPPSRGRWADAYRDAVKRSSTTASDPASVDQALAAVSRLGAVPAPAQKQTLPEGDAEKLQKVLALQTAQDYARADALLQPLAERYPANDEVQDLACTLAQERGAPPATALGACTRAAKLPGAPPHILLLAAHLLLGNGQRAEAVPLLTRAEANVGQSPESWTYLAELQFEAGACSAAEASAARAKGQKVADQVTQECRRIRRRVGYPAQAALTAEQESGYVTAALAAHEKIDQRQLDAALVAAKALRSAFPQMPAGAVAECRARSRMRDLEAIRRACAEAAELAPDAFYPRYVAGLVASRDQRWTDAAAALRSALELDDTAPQIWQSLAAVEQKRHDAAAVQDLQRRFRAKFKTALRPALWPSGWTAG